MFPVIEHREAPEGQRHPPPNWVFANATERAAAGIFFAYNLGMWAYQEDNSTIWSLVSYDSAGIPTWAQIGGSGSGGGGGAGLSDATPLTDAGAGVAGGGGAASREDHRHPLDAYYATAAALGLEITARADADTALSAQVGALVGDRAYTHTQGLASDTWTINHGLGKYPAITVVDSGGTVVLGGITYVSANVATVEFSTAFSGTAYCN